MISSSDRQRFAELTPFYVNGTLGQNDQAFMEQSLNLHPVLQINVDLARAMHSAIKKQVESRPIDAGLDKFLVAFRKSHQKPSLTERIRVLCEHWGFTRAFAAAVALVLVQFAVILQMQFGTMGSAFRDLSDQHQNIPHLKVIINPQTNFADLVVVLRANGCRVVSGPSETGELWLVVETPEKIDKINAELINSGLVDQVISTNSDAK